LNPHTNSQEPFEGPYYGLDLIVINCHPVSQKEEAIVNKNLRVAAIHFLTGEADRMETAKWLSRNYHLFDMVMGDFNTFSDKKGPEMKSILETNMQSMILQKENKIITYKGFSHDVVSIKNECVHLIPEAVVLEVKEKETKLVASDWLDHVYSPTNKKLKCKVTVCPVSQASDHALICAEVII
jgi:endonuclease/exonuclease/phosphatase family metal-dependent hydrolase